MQIDICQFRGDSTGSVVEFHYSLQDSSFVYKKIDDKKYSMDAMMTLTIRTGIEQPKVITWILNNEISSEKFFDKERQELLGVKKILLKPGQYSCSMVVADGNQPKGRDSLVFKILVRKFAPTVVSLSDILVTEPILDDNPLIQGRNPNYVRNGMYVITKPTRELRGTKPVLNTYMELYGLPNLKSDSVLVRYVFNDAAKREVFDMEFMRPIIGNAQTELFSIPLEALNSGAYFMNVILVSKNSSGVRDSSVQISKKFFILNPEMEVELTQTLTEDELFQRSEFATYGMERLDKEFEMTKFFSSELEKEGYAQLTTVNAKQKYLFRFWLMRDPTPNTPVNERLDEYRKAIAYAKKHYTAPGFPEGWNTDRGRILLKYGFPTQIDRQYFNRDAANPHEIWFYNGVQGGVMFVFVDTRRNENFILVHSTAINEVRQENWYRLFALQNAANPNNSSSPSQGGR
jgi:GWxTD domain-containing protein